MPFIIDSETQMKMGDYIASFLSALALLLIIYIVLIPHVDRHHSRIVIWLAALVFSVHAGVLMVYPIFKTNLLGRVVKVIGYVSVISILVLTFASQPNKQVKSELWNQGKSGKALSTP